MRIRLFGSWSVEILFRERFHGREDLFPGRVDSRATGTA